MAETQSPRGAVLVQEGRPEDTNIPVPKNSLYSRYIKRLLDLLLATLGLMAASPIMLVIAILELVFHGRPILYSSERPGKDEKLFRIYKFRSMTNERGEDGELLPEWKRLTRFGRFLRSMSLDELPSLINIIKGDMSIIGPRPLLSEYIGLYPPRYRCRHLIRPGLELAPPAGRYHFLTWREQFENDVYYLENLSFLLDVKQFLMVARMTLARKKNGVRAEDTRLKYDGTNLDDTGSKAEPSSPFGETAGFSDENERDRMVS